VLVLRGARPLGRFKDGEHARLDVFPNAYTEIGLSSRVDLSLRDQGFACPSSTDTVSQSLSQGRVNGALSNCAAYRGLREDRTAPSAAGRTACGRDGVEECRAFAAAFSLANSRDRDGEGGSCGTGNWMEEREIFAERAGETWDAPPAAGTR
jgi:hypothetical protein